MTVLKLAGCLLILAAGGAAALFCIRAERRRLEVLDGWIDLIALVRSRIDCYLMPQDAILSSLDAEQLRRCGGTVPCTSFPALSQASERFLSRESRRIVGSFAAGIGNGYRDEQVRACDYDLDALRDIRKRTAAELPSRIRVRTALCLTAALGAAILLW